MKRLTNIGLCTARVKGLYFIPREGEIIGSIMYWRNTINVLTKLAAV